jgi:rod shape-determining protein MreD
MKPLVYFSSILVLFILQLALADLNILNGTPNLVLVYLCICLLALRLSNVLYMGVLAGVLLDFFSAQPDGIMLSALLMGLVAARYLGQMFFTEKLNNFLVLVYLMVATIAFFLAIMLADQTMVFLEARTLMDWNYMLTYKLGSDAMLNLLALYPVYLYYNLQMKIQNKFKILNESV